MSGYGEVCGQLAPDSAYPGDVDEEWRVSLIDNYGQGFARKVGGPLRGRVSAEVSVTAGRSGVFLYAPTEGAARTAQAAAQDVLAEKDLTAKIRLERWDPERRAWLLNGDPDAGPAPEPELSPQARNARAAGEVFLGILDGLGRESGTY
jgi:hypothetical protein